MASHVGVPDSLENFYQWTFIEWRGLFCFCFCVLTSRKACKFSFKNKNPFLGDERSNAKIAWMRLKLFLWKIDSYSQMICWKNKTPWMVIKTSIPKCNGALQRSKNKLTLPAAYRVKHNLSFPVSTIIRLTTFISDYLSSTKFLLSLNSLWILMPLNINSIPLKPVSGLWVDIWPELVQSA